MASSKKGRANIIDETALVISNRKIADGFYKMRLSSPEVGGRFRPGQFFQLRIHPVANAPLLRRPFAPSEADADGFSFVYAVVGEGTGAMTCLCKGDAVEVLGPLGNGYDLSGLKKNPAVLVGGGCGAPSLLLLASYLKEKGHDVHTILGARSACNLLEKSAFKRASGKLTLATDDGSTGFKGHAVAALEELMATGKLSGSPHVFACGPHGMLRGLSSFCIANGLPCQLSLEERMACGFGACVGCVTKVKAENPDGYVFKRVCKDGPVFHARELMW